MATKSYLWQGSYATSQGACKAGVNFFAGYPITPSTEVAEVMSWELPQRGGVFIQMEDEIASITALIGASLAGAKAITATSGPGFSLMQEGLGYAKMVEAPLVIVNVMRGGPSTGLPTKPTQADFMQAKWGTHGDSPAIVVCPSSVKESYFLMIHAINLSERFRTPVIFLTDEGVAHMRERVDIDLDADVYIEPRKQPGRHSQYLTFKPDEDLVPHQARFGTGYRTVITGLYHDESGFQNTTREIAYSVQKRLIDKVDLYLDHITNVEETNLDDAELAFVSYGITSRTVQEVIHTANNPKWGALRLITLWPFDDKLIAKKLENVKTLIVPELNMGQMVRELQRLFGSEKKIIPVNRWDGELITPQELQKVAESL
ncbi:MAG TPA: 2-oxoacid:acceptor oxidoreductase subunit alpha [Caldisericia bacterium]|nr:2-oxoacid:acceptor oxidoreductase subunit alpha [Caldisericia bacterium]HPF49145.1 2-oxoacid:acceptor oxidoreductase subunit alpha [Caldisericia bacterium]HPI82991.1 2-oxoacid:acceptor oxidoreductase subunit alpha [Caldisericia bacterium]HPQ92218.1 2-oxoacid:acceptor oxidoreductase subunit alpha [Caldisericia bacterium]HRV74684.1 2-oxoacid:acceptor oxidoreductase subunit alpha [Caldisericia bacterium]